jgi:signal transduction histidine kinase
VVKIDPTHPLLLGSLIKPGEGVVGKVWQAGQPLVVNRYRQWPEKSLPMAKVSASDPANVPASVAGIPVRWGNETLGVLIVAAEVEDYFTETDIELLTLFAAQAAVAIHNARLHEQVQHHAARLEQEVAERKRAEAELKQYSERLEEMVQARTKSLEEAQARLIRQEKLAVLGQLAGSVGHELRNPLGVINNALYFLQMVLVGADETVKEYLALIAGRVAEADKIVADLLNLARTGQAARQQVTVSTLFEETLRRYPPPARVSFHQAIAPDLPPVWVDPQQIGQVLTNLVTNAYQAMPEGGQLTLSAQASGDQIRLSVTDTGVGMSPETLEKIFEPLFTTKTTGIGLGLLVSKNLVEVNGGVIKVESVSGKGSSFMVWLPTR